MYVLNSTHHITRYDDLLKALDSLDFHLTSYSQSEAFGDFCATFRKNDFRFEIVRDRSQLSISRSKEELAPFGLWRAFDDPATFQEKLLPWLRAKSE